MDAIGPGPIQRLTTELNKLPGIGPKSAEKIAHYLLASNRQLALDLSDVLRMVIQSIKPCSICHNLTDGDICSICRDPRRDDSLLCVVESPRDITIFERAGNFRGKYHVLGGRLAPLENMGPEKLTFDSLRKRVSSGLIKEVILATSPTLEGDGTALFASNILQGTQVKITRLARGLPSGSSLEMANAQMLADALEDRRTF